MSFLLTMRLSVEFQRFFTALSVRPGRKPAMIDHLLPMASCACEPGGRVAGRSEQKV